MRTVFDATRFLPTYHVNLTRLWRERSLRSSAVRRIVSDADPVQS
jgi:hypothetical protein